MLGTQTRPSMSQEQRLLLSISPLWRHSADILFYTDSIYNCIGTDFISRDKYSYLLANSTTITWWISDYQARLHLIVFELQLDTGLENDISTESKQIKQSLYVHDILGVDK